MSKRLSSLAFAGLLALASASPAAAVERHPHRPSPDGEGQGAAAAAAAALRGALPGAPGDRNGRARGRHRPAEIALLQERLPHFSIQRVEAAGYFVFEEKPEAVVAAVHSATGAASAPRLADGSPW